MKEKSEIRVSVKIFESTWRELNSIKSKFKAGEVPDFADLIKQAVDAARCAPVGKTLTESGLNPKETNKAGNLGNLHYNPDDHKFLRMLCDILNSHDEVAKLALLGNIVMFHRVVIGASTSAANTHHQVTAEDHFTAKIAEFYKNAEELKGGPAHPRKRITGPPRRAIGGSDS